MKTPNKANLLKVEETSKTLSELTPTEIVSALLGCTNNQEVDVIVWRNFETFHENPGLFKVLRSTRHRIWWLHQAIRTPWAFALN